MKVWTASKADVGFAPSPNGLWERGIQVSVIVRAKVTELMAQKADSRRALVFSWLSVSRHPKVVGLACLVDHKDSRQAANGIVLTRLPIAGLASLRESYSNKNTR